MSAVLRVRCWAKVNLSLEILGRRADGFHELRTVFQTVGLADDLTLTRGSGTALIVSGIPVPVEGNLCLRAVELFARHAPVPADLTLALHKRIPVGAGLGGGSSDAAGTLVGLDHWFGPLAPETLHGLAAELGSDVAFFLHGGTALGQGRGELLQPVAEPSESWLVITRPDLHVSTAAAYRALTPADFTAGERTVALQAVLGPGCGLRQVAAELYNAFERPVLAEYPAIAAAKAQLLQAGAEAALLSGSGAAVFGLCADEVSARAVADRLSAAGLWAVAAPTVTGGPHVEIG